MKNPAFVLENETQIPRGFPHTSGSLIIPIVIGTLGTVTKCLVQGLEDLEIRRREESIQTTSLLRSATILRRFLESCCHSNSCERPSADADGKISQ